MDNNAVDDSPTDKPTAPEADAKEIEEMDITDVVTFDGSSSGDFSSSSGDSFDDDNTSQTSDIRVIEEVSGHQVPVTSFEEGKAKIQVPASYKVFFNPVQEFNRDLSIAVLTLFAEDHFRESEESPKKKRKRGDSTSQTSEDLFTINHLNPGIRYQDGIEILEALAASGLRSIRYALEVPGIKQITANDMSRSAVLSIEDNIEINNVDDLVITSQSDAVFLMQQQKADKLWFDAIDLDPYGCPSRFLDSAVNAVRDGGLLLVTCTDMAVLAGNTPESCYSKYGAISLRNSACHEMAMRIALKCIESHCTRYGRYIVPLLSVSADFYIRLFLKVYSSPQKCKQSLSKLSNVFQCNGCCSLTLQPLGVVKDNGNNQFKYSLPNGPAVGETCVHCDHRHHMGGPIWNGPIHDKQFVKRLMELLKRSMDSFRTSKRMVGMITVIDEELNNVPLYYTLNSLANRIHCTPVPLKEFRSALLNGGFEVSMSHCSANSIKTNAPVSVIWDILRCWVKTHPVAEKRLTDPVCANLLKKEPEFIANFDIHPNALPESIKSGLLRYQPNPAPNWGPGCRSKANILGKSEGGKRQGNQNKRKRGHNSTDPSKNCNGNDIPIVTLSDDDSVDSSKLSKTDSSEVSNNKKQKLAELDESVEITEIDSPKKVEGQPKVISIDDDEITEIMDVGSVDKKVSSESEVCVEITSEKSDEKAESIVDNAENNVVNEENNVVVDNSSKSIPDQAESDVTKSDSILKDADFKTKEPVDDDSALTKTDSKMQEQAEDVNLLKETDSKTQEQAEDDSLLKETDSKTQEQAEDLGSCKDDSVEDSSKVDKTEKSDENTEVISVNKSELSPDQVAALENAESEKPLPVNAELEKALSETVETEKTCLGNEKVEPPETGGDTGQNGKETNEPEQSETS